jgi:hypothetical protein
MNQIQAWLGRFKTLDDVGTAFAILAVVVFGLANFLNIARVENLGLAAFGAAIVAWGANAIQTRELRIFQRGIHVWERVEELLARVWGILFALGGLLLLGYGILAALNPREPIPAYVRDFFAAPLGANVLTLGGSAIGMLFALTMILISDAQASNAVVRFVLSLPRRLFGIVLFVVFTVLGGSALLQIFAPGIWQALWQIVLRGLGLH